MRASDNDSLAIHYSHTIAPVTPASPSEEKPTGSTAERERERDLTLQRKNGETIASVLCYYEIQNGTDWMPVVLIKLLY